MPKETPRTGKHRARTLILGVVVVLLLAELITRAIGSNLPAPLQWQSYETQRKVQQIDALSKKGGVPVVFLGSSLPEVGIAPKIIDEQIGHGVKSYDAALASSIPRMTTAWAESVVIPKLHPRVLVLGVGAYDLGAEGGASRTAFYNAFLGSAGAKQAMGTEDAIQKANRWLGQQSALWFHKDQLRDPETVARAVLGRTPPTDPEAADLDKDGRQTIDQFAAFSNQSRVDVTDWSPGQKDMDAVKQLITYAHKRGITVVLVDMPVTNQLVDRMPHGQASYQEFKFLLGAIGEDSHTKVLYFDQIRSDSLFLDDIHLNHAGTDLFSTELGTALKPLVGR
ncbi:MAG TPA: hypothetical protein VHV57_05910 [Acidimicrobiales bacterium]|jgi:hypothetical protein|nr:hypothetical protein [Acidimicrobiales bacterium]